MNLQTGYSKLFRTRDTNGCGNSCLGKYIYWMYKCMKLRPRFLIRKGIWLYYYHWLPRGGWFILNATNPIPTTSLETLRIITVRMLRRLIWSIWSLFQVSGYFWQCLKASHKSFKKRVIAQGAGTRFFTGKHCETIMKHGESYHVS